MKRKQLARIDLSNPDKPSIKFNSKSAFLSDLKDFKHEQRVWVIIEKYHAQRSLSQNSLLHLWLGIIAEEMGVDDIEEPKYFLKEKFLKVPLTDKNGNELADENGEIIMVVKDTSALNKLEFGEFMDKVYRWSLDFLNCSLPLPEQQQELPINNYPTINI